jgi:hypothetical protein
MDSTLSQQMELVLIDDLILQGVKERLHEVFQVPVVFTNSTDAIQALKRLYPERGNAPYPYIKASVASDTITKTGYRPHCLMRRGQDVTLTNDDKLSYRATILPVETAFELTYYDPNFIRLRQFVKTWLFAATGGWLKFTIQYGQAFDVHVSLTEEVQSPTREADPGNTTAYVATANFTVYGYASRPKLRDQQAATEMVADAYLKELGEAGKNTYLFTVRKFKTPDPVT